VDRVESAADGARFRLGDVELEVVATPGHSTGHLAFLVHDGARSDLFTGDTLFFGGRIALQDIWDCDLRAHLDSLRRLGAHRHDGLFPGHLTFSVTDGGRHIQAAISAMDQGRIPRNLE
jgi:glyoxylase-like metal-dependent hydrolase (beta-lactamase superfamily II)